MTADELKKQYKEAEPRIIQIFEDTRGVTTVSYLTKTQYKTDALFAELKQNTAEFCDYEIGDMYTEKLAELEYELEADYGLESDWYQDAAAQTNTVETVRAGTAAKLLGAIATAETCISGYRTQVQGYELNDVEGCRKGMLMQIANNGIAGCAYFRDGEIVNGGLGSYADVVLNGVEGEMENSVVMDTMLANGWDLVRMSYHYGACPLCVPYEDRVYSLTGTSDEYPYLFSTPWDDAYQSFHPNCRHYIYPYFPQLMDEGKVEKMQAYSNRSFEVGGEGWTKAQTKKAERNMRLYKKEQQRKSKIYNARNQYERYKATLGEDKVPKSFDGFWQMKKADGEGYHALMSEYRHAVADNS